VFEQRVSTEQVPMASEINMNKQHDSPIAERKATWMCGKYLLADYKLQIDEYGCSLYSLSESE
jgi:hypothetical protein